MVFSWPSPEREIPKDTRSTPAGRFSSRAWAVVHSALGGSIFRSVWYFHPSAVCTNTVTELRSLVDL